MPMPSAALPLTRDLVLIGGGHTHALVLRMWGMRPVAGVRLTLISPAPAAAYSGMLPGFIAGHYPRDALDIDLVRLARHAGARLVLARATGLDRPARRVLVEGRAPIAYDLVSIDIGISSEMPDLPGFSDHAVPAKPLDAFADRWERFVAACGRGEARPSVAVVGAGVAGVELALAARHRLGETAEVTLVEAETALAAIGAGARRALLRHLDRGRVTLIERTAVSGVEAGALRLVDGRRLAAEFILGAAATRPQGWLAGTGLALHQGFIAVDETLRSVSDPAIFAAGDIAHLTHAPRPKAGVFAVREAPVLRHNLTVAATGRGRMRPYRPQRDYLKLISTGGRRAVADKWGLPLDGAGLWRWKDRIDRRFMAMFATYPAMPAPPLPAVRAEGIDAMLASGKPLCGGCGSKVGRGALGAALAALPPPSRPDILSGPGDDAAVIACGPSRQVLTTDHLRAFTEDFGLMARITALHALGDIWAMGARPQAALAQIILPRMSERMHEETLREILAEASAVLRDAGAEIVGGHTTQGAELTIGFTLTGLAETPISLAGAEPGDALILTRPIGTGVILAAEMQGAAPGAVVAGALAQMARPQAGAAALLAAQARAMTDVTGFGLAGHLLAMLDASGVAAEIDLGAIPVLPGAEALSGAGHGSTLLPANRSALARMDMGQSAKGELLFDPQTAGGLLAAVPSAGADALVSALRAAGEPAARIGRVCAGHPFVTVRG